MLITSANSWAVFKKTLKSMSLDVWEVWSRELGQHNPESFRRTRSCQDWPPPPLPSLTQGKSYKAQASFQVLTPPIRRLCVFLWICKLESKARTEEGSPFLGRRSSSPSHTGLPHPLLFPKSSCQTCIATRGQGRLHLPNRKGQLTLRLLFGYWHFCSLVSSWL